MTLRVTAKYKFWFEIADFSHLCQLYKFTDVFDKTSKSLACFFKHDTLYHIITL